MKKWLLVILMLAACKQAETPAASTPPPAETAPVMSQHVKDVVNQYNCVGCHIFPGMEGGGRLGPSLEHWGTKETIVNKFPNTPENLTKWIVSPPSLDPETTMPAVGVTEAEAQEIAAYLLAQK